MSDNPCNCSTCSHAVQENEESRFKLCPIVDHYVQMHYDGNWIPYTQTAQDIIKCGCASHSSHPASTPTPEQTATIRNAVLDALSKMIRENDMDKSNTPYFIHTSTINGFIHPSAAPQERTP